MASQGSPLYPILNEILAASQRGAPFLAVAMPVALPDTCISLKSDDGRSNGERYKQWCDDNLPQEHFGFVTGADLWSMRCGVLHNGRFGDMKHNVARVIFALPNPQQGVITNCQMGDAYVYSVVDFCKNFTTAVFNWMESNKDDPIVKTNIDRLMQYRNDLPPYISGLPMIA